MEDLVVQSTTNNNQLALWAQRISDCKNSGMTCIAWCEQNGIKIKNYYYWHAKLHSLVKKTQSSFVEVPVVSEKRESSKAAATIRVGMFTADIYSCADSEMIERICKAMKTC